jgi:FkbM family methyltransferase
VAAVKHLARLLVPRKVRNWLRSPSDSMRWALAQARYFAGGTDIVQIRPGWSLVCHPAAQRFAYFAQNNDQDQIAEFDSFLREITPDAVLIDIGAHFGLFSLAVLHYGGPKAISIAVDPSPMAVRFIRTQAELNQVSERLHTLEAAISDKVGRQSMVSVGILSSGYYVRPSEDHTPGELTSTPTTTIDQLVQELDLRPTHVKIDVEGDELAVINGACQILSRDHAPLLFVELHNEMVRQNGGHPQETLSRLRTFGYQTFATNGDILDDQTILESPLIRIVARKVLASGLNGGNGKPGRPPIPMKSVISE